MVRRNAQYYMPILNQFNVGQWVWIFYPKIIPGSCDKLRSYWAGPYKIVRLLATALAEVYEQEKPKIVSLDILKEFRGENNVLGLPRDPPHPAFLGGDEITEIPSSELEKPITVRVKNPHLMCTAACRMWGSPFLSAVDKALPKRAPIAQWSGYKTRLVSDIFALC